MKINDKGIKAAWELISKDNRITRPEAEKLLKSVQDSARPTATERADLVRILAEKGDQFTAPAKKALEDFIKTLSPTGFHTPIGSVDYENGGGNSKPFKLADKGIAAAWEQASKNGKVSRNGMEAIFKSAYDSARITATEKTDLQNILKHQAGNLTPAAKTALEQFLTGIKTDGTNPQFESGAIR